MDTETLLNHLKETEEAICLVVMELLEVRTEDQYLRASEELSRLEADRKVLLGGLNV